MLTGSEPPSDSPKKAFISHSSTDAAFASELGGLLEARGVTCWIAPRDVIPGHPYAEECVRGIEDSAAFVFLASAAAISSIQVLSEVEQAHKRNKPIFTVMIGRPRVPRELDYYISRLHWIELAGNSPAGLADKLNAVLSNKREWTEVASPPSLRRTVLYRRDAFVGSALGTLLVLIAAAVGIAYWMHIRTVRLMTDYRSLGWVTLSSPAGNIESNAIPLHAEVWLGAHGVSFGNVTLSAALRDTSGSVSEQRLSDKFDPALVAAVETLDFVVPMTTTQLASCMTVPSTELHTQYRVTQQFALRGPSGGAGEQWRIQPVAGAVVTTEDGIPCTPLP